MIIYKMSTSTTTRYIDTAWVFLIMLLNLYRKNNCESCIWFNRGNIINFFFCFKFVIKFSINISIYFDTTYKVNYDGIFMEPCSNRTLIILLLSYPLSMNLKMIQYIDWNTYLLSAKTLHDAIIMIKNNVLYLDHAVRQHSSTSDDSLYVLDEVFGWKWTKDSFFTKSCRGWGSKLLI